ncbi:HARB1-like protein, partial [Mya arenaria]
RWDVFSRGGSVGLNIGNENLHNFRCLLDSYFNITVSVLKEHLEATNIGHRLGDSGDPLKRFLMTPYLHPVSPAEERYNKVHKRGRVVGERSFGVLKSRFRCLSKSGRCLPFASEKSANVILCCFKLHNLRLERGLPLPDISTNDVDKQM